MSPANKHRYKTFIRIINACLAVILIMLSTIGPVQAVDEKSEPARIQTVQFDTKNKVVHFLAQNRTEFAASYQMVKLTRPDRLLIDIPNAFLATPTRNLSIQQDGIDRIELSQNLGTFYQVVRLTVYGNSPKALSSLRLQSKGHHLAVLLNEASVVVDPQANSTVVSGQKKRFSFLDGASSGERPESASTAGQNVLQSAEFDNGVLTLKAPNGQALAVKNQFTLSGPSRLVVDLANTVLADKSMTTPFEIRAGPIRSIRLGQFDEETVRIVVETAQPNNLYLVYPGADKSELALSTHMIQSIRSLPYENQKVGFIQDINLERKDEGSLVKIKTTEPMVRRVTRKGDQIEIEMINIAAKPAFVAYDKQQFPDIKEVRLSPLNAQEPNTKLIIKLDNRNVDMDSHLSMDGHNLEILLTPKSWGYSAKGRKMPQLISPNAFSRLENLNDSTYSLGPLPTLKQGAFTVVVDAGHGGKDKGANREGILEKNLNLVVAHKLKNALEAKGVTVHMTRSTDMFLELSQICAITNRIRPDAFISVHTNASVNPSLTGVETYYFTPQSRDLAYRVHRRAVNSIGSPDRGVRTARFYVVHHTSVPAVLFEMGYISNVGERAELQNESRQNATAEALAQGVVEFLGRRITAEAP